MDKTTTVDTVGVVTGHRCNIADTDRIPGEAVVDTVPLRSRHAGLDSAMDSLEEAVAAADSVGLVRRRDRVALASIVVGQWSTPVVASVFVVFAWIQPPIERRTKKVTMPTRA